MDKRIPTEKAQEDIFLPYNTDQLNAPTHGIQRRARIFRAGLLVVAVLAIRCLSTCVYHRTASSYEIINGVKWTDCGESRENYRCANISVPLDYHNASDERTTTIAVTKYHATDKANRLVYLLADLRCVLKHSIGKGRSS